MKPFLTALLAVALTLPAPAALAQQMPETANSAATAFDRRAAQLVDLLTGKVAFADYFDPTFQTAVPEAQFDAIAASLIAQYGQPLAVEKATSTDGRSGTVLLRFEKGVGTVLLDVETGTDEKVTGLRIAHFEVSGDSFDKATAEIAALPGATAFLVAELDGESVKPLSSRNADRQLAIGSTFKLYILDELAAQVAVRRAPMVRCRAAQPRQLLVRRHRQLAKGHARHAADARQLDDLGQRQWRHRHADPPARP